MKKKGPTGRWRARAGSRGRAAHPFFICTVLNFQFLPFMGLNENWKVSSNLQPESNVRNEGWTKYNLMQLQYIGL